MGEPADCGTLCLRHCQHEGSLLGPWDWACFVCKPAHTMLMVERTSWFGASGALLCCVEVPQQVQYGCIVWRSTHM